MKLYLLLAFTIGVGGISAMQQGVTISDLRSQRICKEMDNVGLLCTGVATIAKSVSALTLGHIAHIYLPDLYGQAIYIGAIGYGTISVAYNFSQLMAAMHINNAEINEIDRKIKSYNFHPKARGG